MTLWRTDDISITATSFFMMLVGFWQPLNRNEEHLRRAALSFTILSFAFVLWTQFSDIYHSWGDLASCLYATSNSLSAIMPLFKIFVLLARWEEFFHLIEYMKQKFLHANYDHFETAVLISCKRKCNFFICFFIFLIAASIVSFVVNPIIANIGRNESDRQLPIKMQIDLPLSMTPYFEISFLMQIMTMYPIIFSYLCFDSFLCIMSLHLAGQFHILQHRMSNINFIKDMGGSKHTSDKNLSKFTKDYYTKFKGYIRHHQALITYCNQLEEVFNLIVFVQVITFSLSICLDGYLILLANVPDRRIVFFFHLMGTVCQLLMFTYSCDCIIRESKKLGQAVYSGPWIFLPMDKNVQKLRRDLIMVIIRSNVPCCLTGHGFFIVSLQTYSRVLSTAASYFTLLKERQDAISS